MSLNPDLISLLIGGSPGASNENVQTMNFNLTKLCRMPDIQKPDPSKRSIDYLLAAIERDFLPSKTTPDFIDYGFANLDEAGQSSLLSLYTVLVNLLECNTNDLHKACMAGKLADFIDKSFSTVKPEFRGKYYTWFCRNKAVVNNRYIVKEKLANSKISYEASNSPIETLWRNLKS